MFRKQSRKIKRIKKGGSFLRRKKKPTANVHPSTLSGPGGCRKGKTILYRGREGRIIGDPVMVHLVKIEYESHGNTMTQEIVPCNDLILRLPSQRNKFGRRISIKK